MRSAAGSAALAMPHLLLRAQESSSRPVVGEGEHRYECEHDWGALPEGHSYGDASHGVAFDSEGLVYITHLGGPGSVFVFDPDGKFVRSLAPQHQGEGHGIDIRREDGQDFLYLAPNSFRHRKEPLKATKMTLQGEVVWEAGPPPEAGVYDDGRPYNITNISFCPDGGWHVGDGYGSSYLHRYDKEGRYLCTFGGKGEAPGQFSTPHGHWLDERDGIPKVAVCDRANSRLQWMTLDGQHLATLNEVDRPASLDIRGDLMLCTEVFIGRMALLDRDNRIVARLGEDPQWQKTVSETRQIRAQRDQWRPGRFIHPHDAAFDRDGNIIVAEWVVGGRISRLRRLS